MGKEIPPLNHDLLPPEKRSLRAKFCAMQISYYCTTASFNSFAVTYFSANGHSAAAIGVMLALFTLAAFAGAFLFGQLCDRLHNHKQVFIWSNVAMLGLTALVYFSVHSPFLVVLYALLGLLITPIASNMDTWLLKCFYKTPQEYGLIRGWGSLGYAAFTLFYGVLINRFGFGIMLPFTACFVCVNIALALMIPEAPALPGDGAQPGREGGLLSLLKQKRFSILLAALLLLGLAHCPVYQYVAMIFDSVGASVTYQSLALSFSAFTQVPMMMLARPLSRYSPYVLLLGAAGLYLASNAIIGFSSSALVVLGGYLVAGLAYGLLLPTLRQAILVSSTPETRTTAQSMADAFFGSLAGMASSLAGGFILDAFNVPTLLGVACIITLLVVPLLVALLRMSRRPALRPVPEALKQPRPH